jgi:eukaryotic-like serine/threonine-protein kinase
VGILAFFALTQQLPVPYDDDARYIQRLASGDFEDISSARPDLPSDAHALIRRCLHPQPARRYRNGGQLADALEGLLS